MKTAWQQGVAHADYPTLKGDIETEVVIIGGGITGIVAAYQLALSGRKVVVIEKGTLFKNSTTAFTTGFLSSDIDTDFPDLVWMFGERVATDLLRSHMYAIDLMEEIVKEEKIECEFERVPEYWYATSEKTLKSWSKGIAQAVSCGFDIKKLPAGELPFHYAGAWVFANQGKFHPLKYLVALRKKAEKLGAQFFEHTEAVSIEGDANVMVSTRSGRVHALYVIQATYQPFENPSKLFMKKGMYVSYILELSIPHGVLPIGTYLDDCDPYHYFRVDRDTSARDRMIIGGEDRREELPNNDGKSFAALEDYVKTYFPGLEYRVVRKWNGPILESIDGRAFIGRYDNHHPNRFVATAFSGNGMTYAHLAAEILSGEIENNRHQFAYLYDPMRPTLQPKSLLIKTRDYIGAFFGGYFKNVFRKKI